MDDKHKDELDATLAVQLQAARDRLKLAKRMLRLMPTDLHLLSGIEIIENRIKFFEDNIVNKDHTKPRKRKRSSESNDILARNVIFSFYRDAYIYSTFGYRLFLRTTKEYFDSVAKKKD